jgi:cytochrome o ubiquinol oxidase subunit 2
MVYAMPGMVSQLNLQADRPGVLFGQSSHFSGDGFSDMQFEVKSVPAADFAAWTKTACGPALDQGTYAALARQSQRIPPFAYHGVDPALFQTIAAQKIAPGPGPEPENGSHAGREVSTGGKH